MAHLSSSVLIVVAMGVLVIRAEGESEDMVVKELPAPESQIQYFASYLCYQLFSTQENKRRMCQNNFSNASRSLLAMSSKPEVRCRSENKVTFMIPPSATALQLVALVPSDNSMIPFSIMNVGRQYGEINIDSLGNYTMWSTVLGADGAPSVWLRGPRVPQRPGHQKYDIKLEKPHFDYDSTNKKVSTTLKWKYVGDISPCAEIKIAHKCAKASAGDRFDLTTTAVTRSVQLSGLPVADVCTLAVSGARAVKYHTAACDELSGCTPLPEIPENISIEASEDGDSEWAITVSWSRPRHDPDRYNVTLEPDDGIGQNKTIQGNLTSATFRHVAGQGLFTVFFQAFRGSHQAVTSRRAIFPVRSEPSSAPPLAVWCAAALAAAGALASAAVWWRRRRAYTPTYLYPPDEDKFPKDYGSETGPESGVEDSWEVRPDKVLLHEVIGEGAFGVVRRSTLSPEGKEVAVKMLKDFPTVDEIRSFRAEMELMKSVGAHPHVVSLVGCCSGRRPLIIAEYCSRGDLLSFLRCSWDVLISTRNAKYYNNNLSDYRNDLFKGNLQKEHSKLVVNKLYDLQIGDIELTSLDLLSFCRQIAMGMKFLASNRVVHRDLAARNILVTGDRTLKIADFGLSRDVYQENQYKQKGNGKMPVKWMALESLTRRIYTTQSDVWSFGVVLWEVVTVGAAPYADVPAARLPRLLRAGYRMPRPNNCSKQLYDVMLSCWRGRPRERPTFAALHRQLDELLHSACADTYLSLELDGEDATHTPKPNRYVKMILRGNRVWTRGAGAESYERPLKPPQSHCAAPQSNHYTSPPAHAARPQAV